MKTSTEGTQYVLDMYERALVNEERALAELQTATELIESVEYGKLIQAPRHFPSYYKTMEVVLKPTDWYMSGDYKMEGYTQFTLPDGVVKSLSFDTVKKNRIREIERKIKTIKEQIVFLKQMIAEWKP